MHESFLDPNKIFSTTVRPVTHKPVSILFFTKKIKKRVEDDLMREFTLSKCCVCLKVFFFLKILLLWKFNNATVCFILFQLTKGSLGSTES